MAANFHHWETDPFFFAAEQVQDSVDRLGSMYRFWMQSKTPMSEAQGDKELMSRRRDLGTALDTAKWQLQAFEETVSAVSTNPQNREQHDEDDASERYKQFIIAVRSQITSIENALLSSDDAVDLKVRSLVNLNQDEKDDLARFLCGPRDDLKTNVASSKPFTLLRVIDASFQSQEKYNRDKADDYASFYQRSDIERGTDLQRIKKGVCSNKPRLSHSASERLLHWDDDCCEEDMLHMERPGGHHRSISLGDTENHCPNGSLPVNAEKTSRIMIPENATWSLFPKLKMFSRSGLKRWKDGDATESDHQQIPYIILAASDREKGYYKPEESVPGYISGDVKRYLAIVETMQSLSVPRMRVAAFVLAACGLLGLLSFNAAPA